MASEDYPRKLLGSAQALERVVLTLDPEGGSFGLSFNSEDRTWTAGLEWGQEAPDSPMVAAAAYGVGDSAAEAITNMLENAGK